FSGIPFGLAVVQGPGEVLLFSPKENKPVRSILVGKQPHWLAVSDTGKTAYVTNEGSNDVSVVDIANAATTNIALDSTPQKIVVQPAPTPAAAAGTKVSIVDFSFKGSPVTIKTGDSVTWSNDDGATHTVTFKDGSAGAKSLKPGTTFRRTFDKPGTYDYF